LHLGLASVAHVTWVAVHTGPERSTGGAWFNSWVGR